MEPARSSTRSTRSRPAVDPAALKENREPVHHNTYQAAPLGAHAAAPSSSKPRTDAAAAAAPKVAEPEVRAPAARSHNGVPIHPCYL